MKIETGNNASIITFKKLTPKIHESVFLCEGVKIIGNVEIEEDCSVWYNSVIRGDVHYIKIGARTNIQDMCMLHVTNDRFPINIGIDTTIAHSVSLHGATIGDNVMLGIGCIILDGAIIGSNSIIGAGAVIKEGFIVPEGVLVAGVPGRIIRELTQEDIDGITYRSRHYMSYVKEYRGQV